MSEVLYTSARVTEFDYNNSLPAKLEEMLKQVDLSKFIEPGDYVAVKMHLGSYGAFRTVRPTFIRRIVDAVKGVGGSPFVTDTVRIPGLEYLEVANANGLNPMALGAPVVLADGIFGKDVVNVPAGELLGEIGVASAIHEAQAMIVVSHCKGHIGAGFGGALKNLGMGGIAAKNKDGQPERGRMHFAQNTHLEWDKVLCSSCNQCVDVCPHSAINFDDGQIYLDQGECAKCARCARVCPTGALVAPISEEVFQKSIAEAANAVVGTFKQGKILYINFVLDVQPECDCMPLADTAVVQDQGIIMGDDIVAVDMATLDLIGKAEPLPNSKAMEAKHKGDHLLQRITGKDPYMHVLAAQEQGLGDSKYEIVEIAKKIVEAKTQPAFRPATGRVALYGKGHGWKREGSKHPHPCQHD